MMYHDQSVRRFQPKLTFSAARIAAIRLSEKLPVCG
jgi:hypothetical protein